MKKKKQMATKSEKQTVKVVFPLHSVEKALRIPEAVLNQNAGKECTSKEAASFLGLKLSGPLNVEISSATKYGFFKRDSGKITLTDLAKRILRPQKEDDKISGLREAVLNAPLLSDIYKHYRGENLPDEQFLDNALIDKFKIEKDKLTEFKEIFLESLKSAMLIEQRDGKVRVVDITTDSGVSPKESETLKKLGKDIKIDENDVCFVMMPFSDPLGKYYKLIYEPAIKKAGLYRS